MINLYYLNRIIAAIFISQFFLHPNILAQESKSDLEKRIIDLEKRVRILELRLDNALNPNKRKKKVKAKPRTTTTRQLVHYPLYAKLFRKKLQTGNTSNASDNLALLITFRNAGTQNIKSFAGDLLFKTSYGDSIMSFSVDIIKDIAVNESKSWFGGIPFKASEKSHTLLINSDVENITTEVFLRKIRFSDGSVKEVKP